MLTAVHPAAMVTADDTIKKIHEPWSGHDTQVLVVTVIGIAIVVLLIVMVKMHGFLALTIGSLFVGIGSGIALSDVAASFEAGVGAVLGNVGVLIVLGAMLGKLLADSGGADEIVDKILTGGSAGLPWRMALIAFIIGIPMFFEIGLVLLIPVIVLSIRRSHMPAMALAIPALAGLSVLHGFVPPHPGPLAAIANLHADVGITLAIGLIIAVPTVIIAGPLYARVAARLVPIGAQGAGGNLITAERAAGRSASSSSAGSAGASGVDLTGQTHEPTSVADEGEPTRRPSFALTVATILSPVVLMLIRAAAEVWMSRTRRSSRCCSSSANRSWRC